MDDAQLPEDFEPNEIFVRELTETLQIPQKWAVRALYETGNQDPNLAAQWILENIASQSSEDEDDDDDDDNAEGPEVKMVIVVNTQLQMGAGKMAAQVAHAAVELYRIATRCSQMDKTCDWMLSLWETSGQKKIVLQGDNAQHLLDLLASAKEHKLASAIIKDAGLTEVPAGSVTALAVMGETKDVDQVTGKLALLR